jgi:hypothetical protein
MLQIAHANPANRKRFFKKTQYNADTHTRMSTLTSINTHTHLILMNTSKRLSQLDLEIHEVGHHKHLTAVDDEVASLILISASWMLGFQRWSFQPKASLMKRQQIFAIRQWNRR